MADLDRVWTKRDGTLTFEDGTTPTALTHVVKFEDGTFSYDVPKEEEHVLMDRNEFAAGSTGAPIVRAGASQPMTFTFTAKLRGLTDAALAVLNDILNDDGFFDSDWVSTLDPSSDPKGVGLRYALTGATEDTFFPYCTVNGAADESGEFVVLSMAGRCFAKRPTVATVS